MFPHSHKPTACESPPGWLEIRAASYCTWLSSSNSNLGGSNIRITGREKLQFSKWLIAFQGSHEAVYWKHHLQYNDKTWEWNESIYFNQTFSHSHYLLTTSININAKIISLGIIGSSIISASILSQMINFIIVIKKWPRKLIPRSWNRIDAFNMTGK